MPKPLSFPIFFLQGTNQYIMYVDPKTALVVLYFEPIDAYHIYTKCEHYAESEFYILLASCPRSDYNTFLHVYTKADDRMKETMARGIVLFNKAMTARLENEKGK